MKYNQWYVMFIILLFLIFTIGAGSNTLPPGPAQEKSVRSLPLVIVTVDKVDSLEFFNCKLPSIKKILSTSACGLMNIRSSAGYNNTAGGFLTLGSGSRGAVPALSAYTCSPSRTLPGGTAGSYLYWTFGNSRLTGPGNNHMLIVPGIGGIKNQAATEDHFVDPGRLGTIFRENGWSSCLIGNFDELITPYRPAGLLLMDRQGIIDEGSVDNLQNESDDNFPYLNRFSVSKVTQELKMRLGEKKVIAVEFSDFFRLDYYQNETLPAQLSKVKQETWINFDRALGEILKLQAAYPFSLIIASSSVSREGSKQKNLFAPIVINSPEFQPGLLVSGTTKWPGLVANIDFLPTVVNMAGIHTNIQFQGKLIYVKPVPGHVNKLIDLNRRLIASNANQRRTLDWYMGIISVCWIGGLILTYFNKGFMGEWLITGVAVIPLNLILLPLFPQWSWQVPVFLGLTLILTIAFLRIKLLDKRIMILSGFIWGILIIDQLLGWQLIRYSPLGYSAMAGSRYYGIGNEFMGVFLAVALILAYLINKEYSLKWAPPLILGISILVFCLPQLGAKFGGILVGSAGFPFFLIKFYNVNLKNKKLWFGLAMFVLILAVIGWWDSLRPSEAQTHIGRFIHLVFNRDYEQLRQIISRKLSMNLKLSVVSPWIRIILLALILGIVNRFITKRNLINKDENILWHALLVTGIAAYLFNDSGILALATCLAYGFSVMLLKFIKSLNDHW